MEVVWTSLASLLGLIAFVRAVLPPELRFAITKLGDLVFNYLSFYNYLYVYEFDGITSNELYSSVHLHLSTSASTCAQHATLSRPKNSSYITFGLAQGEKVAETFKGVKVWWQHHMHQLAPQRYSLGEISRSSEEKRYYILKISKQDKDRILSDYLDHILDRAKLLRHVNRERLLYTNAKCGHHFYGNPWDCVPFKHPSTFDTLAMDPDRKQEIINDLQEFMRGEEFYQRVGRAWKRGYLLYGPPGSGKSSMIAAIANFTHFDVFDLELQEVSSNAELRKLLINTTHKSIIVIEDIDCSVNLSDRGKRKKEKRENEMTSIAAVAAHGMSTGRQTLEAEDYSRVTLSGLLNFTDGLWSCCGSERILIFTTNHIDRLDPALLRSGRMDMHIFMSYCTFPAFQILARNYLCISHHPLFPRIQAIIEAGSMIIPAEVSEILIKNREPTEALEALIEALTYAAKDNPKVEEIAADFPDNSSTAVARINHLKFENLKEISCNGQLFKKSLDNQHQEKIGFC